MSSLQAEGEKVSRRGSRKSKAKNPAPYGTGFFLIDAWQLYAGLPARHPAGSTPCCANPLPADLSYSGERSPTNNT